MVFLINGKGEIVKIYRECVGVDGDRRRRGDDRRRGTPSGSPGRSRSQGTFYSKPGERNYFQYGLELSEQGYDAAALVAFERVAKVDPSAITFYNLGTLYMKARPHGRGARTAFERALQLQPDYADANNSLGALLAQSGDVPGGDRAVPRGAGREARLRRRAEQPRASPSSRRATPSQACELYEKALTLQPEFPEALNNLGIFYGPQGDLDRALGYFQQAVEKRPGYGEAANNLALVLNARGEPDKAIAVLQRLLQANPSFEMGYVTLCRVYLKAGNRQEATQVLEMLLQRNPTHPLGLQLLQQNPRRRMMSRPRRGRRSRLLFALATLYSLAASAGDAAPRCRASARRGRGIETCRGGVRPAVSPGRQAFGEAGDLLDQIAARDTGSQTTGRRCATAAVAVRARARGEAAPFSAAPVLALLERITIGRHRVAGRGTRIPGQLHAAHDQRAGLRRACLGDGSAAHRGAALRW